LDEQITAQFLFLLSPARFCFSRSSRGSRGSRGSFGYLSKRVYTTLNLSTEELSSEGSVKPSRPARLALEHMESDNPTTSEVINSLLFNQNISIRQEELDELLEIPSVKFSIKLPFNDQTYPALAALVGKPQSRLRFPARRGLLCGWCLYFYSYSIRNEVCGV
jgi:hypothetical protein